MAIEKPIVTQYGARGEILKIKRDPKSEFDKTLLLTDITKLRDKKEISDRQYETLVRIFQLTHAKNDENGSL